MDIEETIRKLKAKGYDRSVTPAESKLFLDKAAALERKYHTHVYPEPTPQPRTYTVQQTYVVTPMFDLADIVEEGWQFDYEDREGFW